MKLLEKWEDTYYGATNYLYELPNGLQMIHTIKPGSNMFEFDIICKGGAYFEHQIGVPNGTAHLFEHIFAGKPNKHLKTTEKIDEFLFGGRKRAAIETNAHTNYSHIFFDSGCNENASERAVKWNIYRLDLSEEQLKTHLEAERQVVLIERFNSKKDEKNSSLQYQKFINGGSYPRFTKNPIGTVEEIKTITVDDIKKYRDAMFNTENSILAVQSGGELSKGVVKQLNKFSKMFDKEPVDLSIEFKEMEPNKFEVGCFEEDTYEGVLLDFTFLEKTYIKGKYVDEDYKEIIKRNLTGNLLRFLGYEELRDKKKLVYSFRNYLHAINWHWMVEGFLIKCDLKKIDELLESVYELVFISVHKFLKTERGQKWLDSEASMVLFPVHVEYDSSYANGLAKRVLTGFPPYKYFYSKSKKVLLDLTTEEISEYIRELLTYRKPKIWSVSEYKKRKIVRRIMKSAWVE